MKRIVLCITILGTIIAVSVFSLFLLHKNNTRLIEMLDDVIEAYDNAPDEVSEKVDSIERYWEDYYIRISFFTHWRKLCVKIET